MGPALFAWFTDYYQSERAGMATIFFFLIVGGLLLLPVREPARG